MACEWGDEDDRRGRHGKTVHREMVYVEVAMTQAEYERIRTSASWDYNGSVADYLLWKGLGGQRRGC